MLVRRLRDQRGFTTVTIMGVLMVGGLLVMASFAAVDPDLRLSRADQDSKQAYAAAESGLQWYMNGLARDNVYYLKCDNPPAPSATELAPVNQHFGSGATDPNWQDDRLIPASAKWRKLPGSEAEYTVELLPAPGFSACSTTNQYSMIDPEGNMRLRVTGRSRRKTRTILATVRRQNFLDFIYFTHFETIPPATYADPAEATANCAHFRDDRTSYCAPEIQFAANDDVYGPFHTNDNIRVCGNTQFGRNSRDKIEINGPTPWVSGSCGANPDIRGTLVHPAGELEVPPSNAELRSIATSTYRFTGRTEIVLNGSSMTVRNFARWGDNLPHTMPLPENGVIYVENSACTAGYDRTPDYVSEQAGCGTVYVQGTYGDDLTIGAANDIIINGHLTRATEDLLLGLVAYNFVRVYHPCSNGQNGAGSISNLTIQTAILALNQSFLVDNWGCGQQLGRLNVEGAIAQYFRGPVGTSGGTGYLKNYTYNDRLRYREPPYFLDPVLASWRIARVNEQVPAMR